LVNRRRCGEPLISLIGGERFPGHRPEQSIHFTLVVAHLLQLSLNVRDHPVRRLSTMTHINRAIVSIILGPRIITPSRIPIAVVAVIVYVTDQLYPVVMRQLRSVLV